MRTRLASRQTGFTLIEVLVALSIVTIALFAGTQATSALGRSSQRQTDLLLAQICADNVLHSLRLARQMPGVGDSSASCTQANQSFRVDLQVRPTPNPSFLRVNVSIRQAERDEGILQVSTVIGRY